MNDIRFNRGVGGLGRPLAGKDHVSGFLGFVRNEDLPAGFSTTERIKKVFSFEEAIALGIVTDTGVVDITEMYYSIKTAFEANKAIELYISFQELEVTGDGVNERLVLTTDLTKIIEIQRFAQGEIRQIGVLNPNIALDTSQIISLQTACNTLEAEHKPVSVIYAANVTDANFGGLSNLPDLRALSCKNVSVTIGADGGGLGWSIANNEGWFPSIVGLTIGVASLAKVNENIGWVGRFDVSSNPNNEFDVPAFANGDLIRNTATGLIENLNTKGYIFLIKHIGTAGTYFNDAHTAITETSDYAYLENNRTIDKAVRNCRTYLLPSLNAPLYVNPDGTLTEDTILSFRNNTARALEEMQRNGEISAFEVTINPTQNVLTTSRIAINVKIVPVGVARNIEVNIGFAVKVG